MSIEQTSASSDLIQFLQIGKLVGNDSWPQDNQGVVACSADGNTIVVGGPGDNEGVGAIWVFTRNEGTWSQQGGKIVGSDCLGTSQLGTSVAISADGNTVIAGGSGDQPQMEDFVGAAWIFTRTNGVWSQQAKLVGTNYVGASGQGSAVAISADGNTCAVGGEDDYLGVGATWIFSRALGVWSQVGEKLVGTGFAGNASQGASLAMSGDGNTLIVGSIVQSVAVDAPIWVFANNGGWQQQGNYLTASNSINNPFGQNTALAISADGKTFIVGEDQDNGQVGAAWIFTCQSGSWSQQGGKLVGTGAVGNAGQGCSVAISGDGNTAVVGGRSDNGDLENGWAGAIWVYKRQGGVWWQVGSKVVGFDAIGKAAQGGSVAISSDGNILFSGGDEDNGGVGATWVFLKVYTPS